MVLKFGDKILKNIRVKGKSTYLTDNPRILRLFSNRYNLSRPAHSYKDKIVLNFMFFDLVSI